MLKSVIPPQIEEKWGRLLEGEFAQPYMERLREFLKAERASPLPIYPPSGLVFNAFVQTPFDKVRVVIMGQDPYHGPGQAHGLCFSVPPGVEPPPSLKNIFKELNSDLGVPIPSTGCLLPWAQQGVLLLNATLTVREGQAGSHHGKGWEQFTDAVVRLLVEREEPVIFVLWGKSAQTKCQHVMQDSHHKVLKAAHPSPLSAHAGFFGCRHFSQINALLKSPISWLLDI